MFDIKNKVIVSPERPPFIKPSTCMVRRVYNAPTVWYEFEYKIEDFTDKLIIENNRNIESISMLINGRYVLDRTPLKFLLEQQQYEKGNMYCNYLELPVNCFNGHVVVNIVTKKAGDYDFYVIKTQQTP